MNFLIAFDAFSLVRVSNRRPIKIKVIMIAAL